MVGLKTLLRLDGNQALQVWNGNARDQNFSMMNCCGIKTLLYCLVENSLIASYSKTVSMLLWINFKYDSNVERVSGEKKMYAFLP